MAIDLIAPQVQEHLDQLVPIRTGEMLTMETYAKAENFPIIGPASGYLCYQIARMIGARRIFELGSGYGYSTAWFAKAVQENQAQHGGDGEVYHVVWSEELSQKARKHLGALGFDGLIRYKMSEAVQALRETEGPFDLIFNDIDKHAYPDSLPVIASKLRPGGVLIIDNMLWSGRIFDEKDHSEATRGVREFTRLISNDPAWISSVIPIRDGLIVAYKR